MKEVPAPSREKLMFSLDAEVTIFFLSQNSSFKTIVRSNFYDRRMHVHATHTEYARTGATPEADGQSAFEPGMTPSNAVQSHARAPFMSSQELARLGTREARAQT